MNSVALLPLLLPLPLLAAQTQVESFDAPGSSWSDTIFVQRFFTGGAMLVREPLSAALGAPDTVPPLPINAGRDLEGRLLAPTGGSAFALTADEPASVFRDGTISANVAFGLTASLHGVHASLLLRASIDPDPPFGVGLHAYSAFLSRKSTEPGIGRFWIARRRNGVITGADILAEAVFTLAPGPENYRIEFEARGTQLLARLWRLTAHGGRVAPKLVPLGGGSVPNQLVAIDGALDAGRAGFTGFTSGTNSVFVDDVVLKPVPAPPGIRADLRLPPVLPAWIPGLPWSGLVPLAASSHAPRVPTPGR